MPPTTMAAQGAALDSLFLNSLTLFLSSSPRHIHPFTQQQQATRSLSSTSASASKELSFDVSNLDS